MSISDNLNKAGKTAQAIGKNVGKGALKAAASRTGITLGLSVLMNRASGQGWGKSAVSAAGDAIFQAVAPGAYWALFGVNLVKGVPGAYYRGGEQLVSKFNQNRRAATIPTFSYQDSQQALTMRQASVQAIQGSKLNARNSLGGEASLMHKGYKDRYGK